MKTLAIKKIILLLFLVFSVNQIFAQTLNDDYKHGQYYDLDGVKHIGFISYSFNALGTPRIRFKTDSLSSASQKIELKSIKGMVIYHKAKAKKSEQDAANSKDTNTIKKTELTDQPKMAADSFVVLNVIIDNSNSTIEVQLGKYLTEGVQAKIYSRNEERTKGSISNPNYSNSFNNGYIKTTTTNSTNLNNRHFFIKTFYMCEISGKVFELRHHNFKELLNVAFADDHDLLEKINTKKYRFRNLGTIISEYKKFKSH